MYQNGPVMTSTQEGRYMPEPARATDRPPFVEPGTGWPGDPAARETPVARDAAQVTALSAEAADLEELRARMSVCRACPRLVAWREEVAVVRRRSFAAQRYWGRPTPSWGDPRAAVLILGLAPAANGGNRTGRIFTGDRSADWLHASLYRTGLAAGPTSVAADDGQHLEGARMAAAVGCAPPQNKPTGAERATCSPWLVREIELIRPTLRVIVPLGAFAWQAVWPALKAAGYRIPRPRPVFGHGAEATVATGPEDPLTVLGCYHPSQQNTFTGRLTETMLDDVFGRACRIAGLNRELAAPPEAPER